MVDRNETRTGVTQPAGLFRNRDYVVLVAGQVVSFVGSQVQDIALPLLVLAITGSPLQAGLVLGASAVAYLVASLVAGGLVDRWNRKRVMMVCDGARAVLTLSIAAALWAGHLTMPHLYLAVAVLGALGIFFSVANTAALPNVVREDQLTEAIGQVQTLFSALHRRFGEDDRGPHGAGTRAG